MVDYSNIFFRRFTRLLTVHSPIYTEMLHHNSIEGMTPTKFDILEIDDLEHPVILQLGGCDPDKLAKVARLAEKYGYDEINLNVGCPSPRVQCGAFGACLMREPELVGKCMVEIAKAVNIPVTVKCRLGIDDQEDYEFIRNFVTIVSQEGRIDHFVVHARNAILKGLNPVENRTIPPLKYEYVFQLQKDFPDIKFTLNGGIKTLQQAKQLLTEHKLEGCMIGRTAINTPWDLAKADEMIFNRPSENHNRKEILEIYGKWADEFLESHPFASKSLALKPVLNLFAGERHNREYKQFLSDHKNMKTRTLRELFAEACEVFDAEVLGRRKYDK